MPKNPRPPSVMGDDERAKQQRVKHPWPPQASSASGEITLDDAAPEYLDDDDEKTPPPILVDDIGRRLSRSRRPSPHPDDARSTMTTQEFAESMWPLRKVPDQMLDVVQRVSKLEEQQKVSLQPVASLRAELIGEDGDGGIIGHFVASTQRDLQDHKRVVSEVDDRATKSARFVRRVIAGAASIAIASLGTAVMLIYRAGEHAAESRGAADSQRIELMHKFETLDNSLTDLRGQVRLLLDHELARTPP